MATCEIKVVVDTQMDITRYSDPDERWDANDTCSSHNILGIEEVKNEHDYSDLTLPFEIEKSKEYLLYCVYSTGNSFGRSEHSEIEHIGLYKTEEEAKYNQKQIDKHYQNYTDDHVKFDENSYNVNLKNEIGTEYKLCAPWCGYFESLSYSEILPLSLEKSTNNRRITYNV